MSLQSKCLDLVSYLVFDDDEDEEEEGKKKLRESVERAVRSIEGDTGFEVTRRWEQLKEQNESRRIVR